MINEKDLIVNTFVTLKQLAHNGTFLPKVPMPGLRRYCIFDRIVSFCHFLIKRRFLLIEKKTQ